MANLKVSPCEFHTETFNNKGGGGKPLSQKMTNRAATYKYNHTTHALTDSVSQRHFGSGFENRGQKINHDSSFCAVERKIGLDYLRFPGGTQTENYFDPENPNNSKPEGIFNNVGKSANFTPIKDFLDYTSGNNMETIIVMPTWRYFDEKTGFIKADAQAEIKDFIHKVLTGHYGDAKIKAFEIGNEWFNDNFNWTPAQFGEVQSKIAQWIHEVKSELNLPYDPKILAQTNQSGDQDSDKNGINDNAELLSAFNGKEMHILDGVIEHFYQPTRSGNVLDEGYFKAPWIPQKRVNQMEKDGWKVNGENALEIFVTEWNVRDSDRANEQTITGFERLPMFLRLFSEMQLAGVDAATIFTTQALGKSHAPLSRLGEDTLTPTGHLFKMMKNALPGTKLVDPDGDGTLSRDEFVFKDDTGQEAGLTYIYSSDSKTVVYFSSAVDHQINLQADFKALINDGYRPDGTITKPIGRKADDKDIDASLETLSYGELDGKIRGDGVLNVDLGAYELVQIEFTKGQADTSTDEFVF